MLGFVMWFTMWHPFAGNIGGAGAMMAGTGLCGGTTSGDQGSSTTTSTTTTTTMSPPSGDGGSGAGKSGGVATVLNNPMGIAVDSAINVFAVNNGNSELVKVNDSGTVFFTRDFCRWR